MMATRTTQPYRKGKSRPAGSTLAAMLRGSSRHRPHPHAAKRMAQKVTKKRRKRGFTSVRNPYNRGQRVS